MERRRGYLAKIEIVLEMITHSPWREMELGMIVTNFEVYEKVHEKYPHLVSQVNFQNHPLQYLYDSEIADESLIDESGEGADFSLLNSAFSADHPNYSPNIYCQRFEYLS